jgi:hypothetical protein
LMVMDIKKDAWDNFISAMDYDSDDKNFIYDFKVMTKKYGQAYMEYCKAMWQANDGVQSEDEFMRMNGDIPVGYFNKVIKGE